MSAIRDLLIEAGELIGEEILRGLSIKIVTSTNPIFQLEPQYFRPDRHLPHSQLLEHHVATVCNITRQPLQWKGYDCTVTWYREEPKLTASGTGNFKSKTVGIVMTKLAIAVWKNYHKHETQSIHNS